MLKFNVSKTDKNSLARRGEIRLSCGTIQTPAFMPVGTVGVVKTLLPEEVKALGADIILGNTYHLYLRPGHQEIKKQGGLAKWNHWNGPTLTDSGGFQVFSLGGKNNTGDIPADQPLRSDKLPYDADEAKAGLVKIAEEGAHFTSHLDGSKHLFTPENVIDIQTALGSDIMMVLDECTEYPATYERAKTSMERTHRWAKRAIDYFNTLKGNNNLFGIVQGSTYQDLREESARYISSLPFDGIAVGGVSVGEGKDHMYSAMNWTGLLLPVEKPHYLMGIGEGEDLIRAVATGFDMFDCVLPTRLGRYGVVWKVNRNSSGQYQLFSKQDLRANRFRNNPQPIDEECDCPACASGYSTGFIGHLLREREVVGIRLCTLHNLRTILRLIADIRSSIEDDNFSSIFASFLVD